MGESHSEVAEERFKAVIKPYEKALGEAGSVLEEKDWGKLISFSDEFMEAELTKEDFEGFEPFSSSFDLGDYEKEYASRLGNIGIIVPKEAWSGKLMEKNVVSDDSVAMHIEGDDMEGPFGLTGLSITSDNGGSGAREVDILHESMHSSFPRYSFYYEEKKDGLEKASTESGILERGREFAEVDMINEMNSYRSEESKSWEDIAETIVKHYVPDYVELYGEGRILRKVYGLDKNPAKGVSDEEKKLRRSVSKLVRKKFSYLPEKARLACSSLEDMEGRYSEGLISHIIYNCSSLDDLIDFERSSHMKERVLQSLEAYSALDSFYLPAFEEAVEKLG